MTITDTMMKQFLNKLADNIISNIETFKKEENMLRLGDLICYMNAPIINYAIQTGCKRKEFMKNILDIITPAWREINNLIEREKVLE